MNQDLLLTLIGLGVILLVIVVLIIKSIKKTGDKQEANDFLEGLSNELKELILKTITSFSIDDLADLDQESVTKIETEILKAIYNTCWNYVKNVVENNIDKNQDFFTQAVLALLENKGFVEEFIRKLIDSESLTTIIHTRAASLTETKVEERIIASEKEDKELQEEFSDQKKYVEESNEEDLTKGEVKEEPSEEELSKLNPQIDEEEELDPENDSSVEVIEDDEEDDDIYYDKSGRPRSKKTGKWVKIYK